jgi:hypothetical protein
MSRRCIIGEVSTANDDLHDNFFVNPEVGRYPGIQEDEPPIYARSQPERLRSDQSHELWRDAASDSSARWQSPKIPQCAHFTTRFLCLRSLRVTIREHGWPGGKRRRPLGPRRGDFGIRSLRSVYDPRGCVFDKHSARYGVARSTGGVS